MISLDLSTIEERSKGHWDSHIAAHNCWSIKYDCLGAAHRKKYLKRHLCEITD